MKLNKKQKTAIEDMGKAVTDESTPPLIPTYTVFIKIL